MLLWRNQTRAVCVGGDGRARHLDSVRVMKRGVLKLPREKPRPGGASAGVALRSCKIDCGRRAERPGDAGGEWLGVHVDDAVLLARLTGGECSGVDAVDSHAPSAFADAPNNFMDDKALKKPLLRLIINEDDRSGVLSACGWQSTTCGCLRSRILAENDAPKRLTLRRMLESAFTSLRHLVA